MSRQFDRQYDLTVKTKTSSRIIKGLRIRFSITKTLLSTANLAKIEIYNTNNDTLAAVKEKFSEVILNAGYKNNVKLLFTGKIRNVFQKKVQSDRILIIYAGDGEQDLQNSIFNKTLSQNVSIRQAVLELASSFKDTTIGTLQGLETPADKLRGQTLSGSTKDILDKLAEDYKFQWSIQNSKLTTVPDNTALKGKEAILINGLTGMINIPTVTELGANVITLLNPEIIPNRLIKIESQFADVGIANLEKTKSKRTSGEGVYKTYKVIFKGDTHTDEWYSLVEGRITNV